MSLQKNKSQSWNCTIKVEGNMVSRALRAGYMESLSKVVKEDEKRVDWE